jgi:hypothetical protein
MLMPDTAALLLRHNPRCSQNREAKALLDARGIAYEERLALEGWLSRAALALPGRPPAAILEPLR